LVGDRVLFLPGSGDEHGWITEILPRTSVCLRPPVANISLLVIVVAPQPEPDWLLVDKLLVGARFQNLKTILVVNKSDLNNHCLQTALCDYRDASFPVIGVSSVTGEGLDELRGHMAFHIACIAGQSGVGKSTLLNKLFGFHLDTGDISHRISRGKHTTRTIELLEADNLAVLDTPGFSLLELQEGMEPVMLKEYYPDFISFTGLCRFSPCYHSNEPGCAVRAAVRDGKFSGARLLRYQLLLNECSKAWCERYE